MSYSFRLAARVLLYAPSHRQDNTYHSLCYTSRGALAGMRNREFRVHTQSCTTNFIFIFLSLPTYLLNIYYTNTGSNQTAGIYWPHKRTLYDNKSSHVCHQWHSRLCKMFYQTSQSRQHLGCLKMLTCWCFFKKNVNS